MAEAFQCDQCGKRFSSEADAQQHTQSVHGERGVSGYSPAGDRPEPKKEEPGGRVTPY